MWLDDCTQEEEVILFAIASLVGQLTRPWTEYAEAMLQINRSYFGKAIKKLADHNPLPGSMVRQHDVRVTERWR